MPSINLKIWKMSFLFFCCFILDIIFFTLFSWVLLYIDFVESTHKAAVAFARQHVSFSYQCELISSSSSHHHHHHHHRHFNSRDCVSNSHQGQILGQRRKKNHPRQMSMRLWEIQTNFFFLSLSLLLNTILTHPAQPPSRRSFTFFDLFYKLKNKIECEPVTEIDIMVCCMEYSIVQFSIANGTRISCVKMQQKEKFACAILFETSVECMYSTSILWYGCRRRSCSRCRRRMRMSVVFACFDFPLVFDGATRFVFLLSQHTTNNHKNSGNGCCRCLTSINNLPILSPVYP